MNTRFQVWAGEGVWWLLGSFRTRAEADAHLASLAAKVGSRITGTVRQVRA